MSVLGLAIDAVLVGGAVVAVATFAAGVHHNLGDVLIWVVSGAFGARWLPADWRTWREWDGEPW